MTKVVPVSEVAEVNPGPSAPVSGRVSFLPMAGVSEEGVLLRVEERDAAEITSGYRYFEQGDVLVAKITPCMENGKAAIATPLPHKAGFGSTEFHVLRPTSAIDGRYLFYMVWNPRFRAMAARNMTGTAGQKRVPTSFFQTFKIPVPPLPEQKRIAAILDKADAIRCKRRESLRILDDFLRSVFLDMFGDPVKNPKGWPVKPLADLAEFVGGGTPSRENPAYFAGKICWATSKDMRGEVLRDTEEHVTEKAVAESATKLVSSGTILIVVKSKILMHRLPVLIAAVPTCFGQDLKGIVPNSALPVTYLARHIRIGQRVLLEQARGVNTEGLTLDHLRRYRVMLPPCELMECYVRAESAVLGARKAIDRGLTDAEKFFHSILQRAFRGEL